MLFESTAVLPVEAVPGPWRALWDGAAFIGNDLLSFGEIAVALGRADVPLRRGMSRAEVEAAALAGVAAWGCVPAVRGAFAAVCDVVEAWRTGDESDAEFVVVRQRVWGSLAREELAFDLAVGLVLEVFEDRCVATAAASLAVAA
jgi:hypothetical protein